MRSEMRNVPRSRLSKNGTSAEIGGLIVGLECSKDPAITRVFVFNGKWPIRFMGDFINVVRRFHNDRFNRFVVADVISGKVIRSDRITRKKVHVSQSASATDSEPFNATTLGTTMFQALIDRRHFS